MAVQIHSFPLLIIIIAKSSRMHYSLLSGVILYTIYAAAQTTTSSTATATTAAISEITGCHYHGETYFCIDNNGVEGSVTPAPTNTGSAPTEYTGCHLHGSEVYCFNGDDEVEFVAEGSDDDDSTSTSASGASAATITSAPTATEEAASETGQTTAVTACHWHDSAYMCENGAGVEGTIKPTPTASSAAPSEYTGCHAHGSNTFCMDGSEEVQFVVADAASTTEEETESADSSGVSCHFHAGVEHCVDADGNTVEQTCGFVERDRNKGLRVGLLFAILAGTTFAVTLPVMLQRFAKLSIEGIIFTIFKQFGTGVILSTALVHLLTHAQLMFANTCIGNLAYESTATAIAMAGVFVAFCFEFIFSRLLSRRQETMAVVECEVESNEETPNKTETSPVRAIGGHDHNAPLIRPQDKISVWLIEAGIIFHSILIGLTMVVAGDSGLIVLFIVILFHQMFEGIALGARISGLTTTPFSEKLIMCGCYAVTTPIGMAIGLGVLTKFNGNDKSTVIALGTIDSFSAGILLWTGLVDMLAMDWVFGPVATYGLWKTGAAFLSLISGMLLMSVLGKWT